MESSSEELEVDINEFWSDLEPDSPESPVSPTKHLEFPKSSTLTTPSLKQPFFKAFTMRPSLTPANPGEQSILEIRRQNHLEVESVKQQVKNRTRLELKCAVEEINQEFEKEIHVIRLEHNKMKDEISKKKRELNLLGKFLSDQDMLISQNRLENLLPPSAGDPTPAFLAEKKALMTELNVLKVQIVGMKEGIIDYTNQTFAAAAKIKDLDQQIAQLKQKNNEELKKLEGVLLEKLEKAKDQRDIVKNEYNVFRKSGWKEIEDKEESLSIKSVIISELQKELKIAKGILHHPKLKLRVHNRLKDYVDEYEHDPEDIVNTTIKSRQEPSSYRARTIEKVKKGFGKADFDYAAQFLSTYSDTTNHSKLYTRRSTISDGIKTRLSPLSP